MYLITASPAIPVNWARGMAALLRSGHWLCFACKDAPRRSMECLRVFGHAFAGMERYSPTSTLICVGSRYVQPQQSERACRCMYLGQNERYIRYMPTGRPRSTSIAKKLRKETPSELERTIPQGKRENKYTLKTTGNRKKLKSSHHERNPLLIISPPPPRRRRNPPRRRYSPKPVPATEQHHRLHYRGRAGRAGVHAATTRPRQQPNDDPHGREFEA